MKAAISSCFTLLSIIINAQNPFVSIGKEAKVLTLSNGKYDEFHEYQKFERVGTAIINLETQEVVSFVDIDTLYSEATLEPTVITRWLSPDPLASKFPHLSPYNFVGNMPTIAIDPDGREIVIIGTSSYINMVYGKLRSLARTQAGYETLVQVLQSDDILVIQSGNGGNIVYGAQPNGEGNTRVYFDFDGTYPKTNPDGSENTDETIFNHELTHFLKTDEEKAKIYTGENTYDSDFGEEIPNTISSGEIEGVEAGNKIRATYGMELRITHSGVDVFDKTVSDTEYETIELGDYDSYSYWKLVPSDQKFDASHYLGQFTLGEQRRDLIHNTQQETVKPGTYDNRNTTITKETKAVKLSIDKP